MIDAADKKRTSTTGVRKSVHLDDNPMAQELKQVKKQAEDYLAGWQRAKADYGNLQKRTDEQKALLIKTATKELVLGILPVIDNFERALESANESKEVDNKSRQELLAGFELIHKQLIDVLAGQGVTRIIAMDVPFDPENHEALGQVPGKANHCIIEHQAGYLLQGQLLRPAKVSVGSGNK